MRYTGFASLLRAALGTYHGRGFRLIATGEDWAKLYYNDQLVESLDMKKVCITEVHRICLQYLQKIGEE